MRRTVVVTGAGSGIARAIGLTQFGAGSALLLRPHRIAAATATPGGLAAPAGVARALGGRLLIQGLVTLVRPAPSTMAVSGAVDVLHALSMVGVAARPGYRRPALISGGFAATSAAVALRCARRGTTR